MSLFNRRSVKYGSIWFIMEKNPLKEFWHKARKKVCKIVMRNIKPTKSSVNIFVYKRSEKRKV